MNSNFLRFYSLCTLATKADFETRGGNTAERFNIYLFSCRRQIHSAWVIYLVLLPSLAYPLQKVSEDELTLVNVAELIPGIVLDIRYATENNFTKHVLYSRARCYLRAPVARKLAEVQGVLTRQGLGLKIFDCYRPLSVQKKLWNLVRRRSQEGLSP